MIAFRTTLIVNGQFYTVNSVTALMFCILKLERMFCFYAISIILCAHLIADLTSHQYHFSVNSTDHILIVIVY